MTCRNRTVHTIMLKSDSCAAHCRALNLHHYVEILGFQNSPGYRNNSRSSGMQIYQLQNNGWSSLQWRTCLVTLPRDIHNLTLSVVVDDEGNKLRLASE